MAKTKDAPKKTSDPIDFQSEIDKFVNYSGILNKESREEIVNRLTKRFKDRQIRLEERDESYYKDRTVNQIIWVDNILELLVADLNDKNTCKDNDELLDQVIVSFIKWIEEGYKKTELANPYIEDETLVNSFKKDREMIIDNTKALQIIDNFGSIYKKNHLSIFYKKKYNEAENNKLKTKAVKIEILKDLEKIIVPTKLEWILKELFKDINDFKDDVNGRFGIINNMINRLGSFYKFMMADYWKGDNKNNENKNDKRNMFGGKGGNWQNTIKWNDVLMYAKLLERDKDLQKLAEMLGKYRESEKENIDEIIKKVSYTTKKEINQINKSEITGIHYSDDLSNLLPSEISMLCYPELEVIFSKNYVEKKLLTWKYVSQETKKIITNEEEVIQIEVSKSQDKQGPIIVCVDTSGSMQGDPERIAKTITFALTSIAMKERRRCYLISFSIEIECMELSGVNRSINNLISFLEMGFNGGTDLNPAFRHTMKMLDSENYKKADVLVVSDFGIPPLSGDVTKKIRHHQKENGTKFHSLNIGSAYSIEENNKVFDNNWVYDPARQGIKNLSSSLLKMKKII